MDDMLLFSSNISTHILTKRMTEGKGESIEFAKYFNSHPHEEDDKRSCRDIGKKLYFNSHPHEEDDAKTRQDGLISLSFQLTSSRRG